MRLKKVVFYQAVKLWDGNSTLTVNEGDNKKLRGVTIDIEDHMVTLECPDEREVIIVGTSNMREARCDRSLKEEKPSNKAIAKMLGDSDAPKNSSFAEKLAKIDVAMSEGLISRDEAIEELSIPAKFDPSKYTGKEATEKVAKPAKAPKNSSK